MNYTYAFIRVILKLITRTFFREIDVIGTSNVPKNKATIIVGIHRNQFVDAIMIAAALEHRDVKFIVAAKSYRKPIIGDLARVTGGIPVERPQDLAKLGAGKIISNEKGKLKGKNTQFSKDLKVGDMILIQKFEDEVAIKDILSDEEIVVSGLPPDASITAPAGYKIIPKVDQSQLFSKVWEALKNKECIGIFPEGGSHDRPDFLPLKAGVCIMALGAMAMHDIEVDIVPCGLTYYKGHQFRSKATLEFGTPMSISKEMVELYKVNKKEAITNLLSDIESKLRDVTLTAPSYSLMMCVHLLKSIYKPDNAVLSQEQDVELSKRFVKGYEKMKEDKDLAEIVDSIKHYRSKLRLLGIEDYQVKSFSPNFIRSLKLVVVSLVKCVFSLIFAIPGLIISAPFALALSYLGEKERRKALAGSKVKILGKDVVASYKIICAVGMFPFYAFLFAFLYYLLIRKYITPNYFYQFLLTISFFFLWPLYAYIMVRSADNVMRHFKTLKAKMVFLFDESKYSQLRFFRKTIQVQIRDYVNKHGEEMFGPDFSKKRIFKAEDFQKDRKSSAQLKNVFASLEEVGI